MGSTVVPGTAGALAEREDAGLTAPTFWGVLMTGLPGFLREGFLPLGAFYAGLRLERARGRDRRGRARLGPDLPLRAPSSARDGRARQDLARLRRRAGIDRARRRTARPVYLAQRRCCSRRRGARVLDLGPARPAAGGRARRRVVPVPALASARARLQARLRRRVGRLGASTSRRSALRLVAAHWRSVESFFVVVVPHWNAGDARCCSRGRSATRSAARRTPSRPLDAVRRMATLAGELRSFPPTTSRGVLDADRQTAGDLEVPDRLRRRGTATRRPCARSARRSGSPRPRPCTRTSRTSSGPACSSATRRSRARSS